MYRERENLMKKSALMVQCEASNKYNPYTLSRYLTRETDGAVIVDRTKATQNKDDERLFLVVLNREYLWRYRDFEHVTMYFEIYGKTVVGGIYNTRTKKRETQCVIATEIGEGKAYDWICYSYNADTLNEIIRAIQNAPQRAK